MASHLVSHWKWDFLELGNGLLQAEKMVTNQVLSEVTVFPV